MWPSVIFRRRNGKVPQTINRSLNLHGKYFAYFALAISLAWGGMYAIALFLPQLTPPDWISALVALSVGAVFVIAANARAGVWVITAAIFSMVLSGGEIIAITRQDMNTNRIQHIQSMQQQIGYEECVRVQDLRTRVNHNSHVIYSALVLIANSWKSTDKQLKRPYGQLLALAETLGVEAKVNCNHPDGAPKFMPIGEGTS